MLPSLLLAAVLATQPVTESIEVRVLEIEAAVVDRDGNTVDGLTRDDFEVRIDGKPRDVTNFYAVRRSAIVDETRTATAAAPRVAPAATTISTSLIVFVDDTRLRQSSKKRALDALERYVRANVGHLTTATLIRYDGSVVVRIRPTERPGHLINEIERMRTEPARIQSNERERAALVGAILSMLGSSGGGPRGAIPDDVIHDHEKTWRAVEAFARREMHEVERTLQALHDTVDLISGFEGRKVLLYLSEGLPATPGIELFEMFQRVAAKSPTFAITAHTSRFDLVEAMRYSTIPAFQRVAKTAQRAGVAFYSFDAAGVRTFYIPGTEFIASPELPKANLMRDSDQGGVRLLAHETGGRFIGNENDFDSILATMSEQFTTYYSLGVRYPSKARPVNVHVRVKGRPELRVIAARRRASITRAQQIAQNVRSRLYTRASDNPLGVTLAVTGPMTIDGACVAPLQISGSSFGDMAEIHFAVLNDRNDESDVRTAAVTTAGGSFTHAIKLGLQPQPHVLSIAVVDRASGAVSYMTKDVDGAMCR